MEPPAPPVVPPFWLANPTSWSTTGEVNKWTQGRSHWKHIPGAARLSMTPARARVASRAVTKRLVHIVVTTVIQGRVRPDSGCWKHVVLSSRLIYLLFSQYFATKPLLHNSLRPTRGLENISFRRGPVQPRLTEAIGDSSVRWLPIPIGRKVQSLAVSTTLAAGRPKYRGNPRPDPIRWRLLG